MNVRDRDHGASAVEYGLLIAGIAAIIVTLTFGLGHVVGGAFDHATVCLHDKGC
jgi:pilus assembly protein Flp/PilA